MSKVFTPKQVFIATLLGTVIGGTYCLMKNFNALGKKDQNKKVLISGAVLLVLITFPLYFVSDLRLGYYGPALFDYIFIIIYLAICYFFSVIALYRQMPKSKIADSPKHDFVENWKVIIIGALSLIAFLAFNILFYSVFSALDLIQL